MVDLNQYEGGEIFSPLQKDLMSALSKKGPMTRAEIVKEINKPRTTVYDNLMGLMAHNIVKKYSRSYQFAWTAARSSLKFKKATKSEEILFLDLFFFFFHHFQENL